MDLQRDFLKAQKEYDGEYEEGHGGKDENGEEDGDMVDGLC